MDKKEKDCGYRRPLRKHLIAALAGGLLGALIVGLYFMPPRDSGQLAAWVQALGSIGAILAAVYIMKKQLYKQSEADLKRQVRERGALDEDLVSLIRLLDISCVRLNTNFEDLAIDQVKRPEKIEFKIRDISLSIDLLSKIEVSVYPGVRVSPQVYSLQLAAIRIKEAIDEMIKADVWKGEPIKEIETSLVFVQHVRNELSSIGSYISAEAKF